MDMQFYHTKFYDDKKGSIRCKYCNKEIKPVVRVTSVEDEYYWHCDCKDAKAEVELRKHYDR